MDDEEEPGRARTERTGEGVRIIGAEEAAEALDRGDVVQRRSDDEPKFGDVPERPKPDASRRPILRFPLPEDGDDPSIVTSRAAEGGPEETGAEDDDASAWELGEEVESEPEPVSDDTSLLPHWTDPPTGEVPAALAGDDELAAWSFSTATPRWRDRDDHSDEDLGDVLGESVGIRDESDRETEDSFFSFDDIETPEEPPTLRVGPARSPVVEPPEAAAVAEAEPSDRNLATAVAAGVGLAAVALITFSIGPAAAMGFVTVLLLIATAEFLLAARQAGYQPATLLGLAAAGGLVIAAYNFGYAAYPVVMFLSIVFGLLWYLVGVEHDRPVLNLGVTLLGVWWVAGLGSFAALILVTRGFGPEMVIAAAIATVSYDTAAYFVGRSLGHSPLASVSPGKTVEGLVGGCLFSILATTVIVGLSGIDEFGGFEGAKNAALLGVVAAITAPIGDLAESLIKRDLGTKDMGSLMPGHGGLLDRFDGLLFVLPSTYFLALILGL